MTRMFAPWGKLKRDETGSTISWLSVQDHCADVAACCESFLASEVLANRLAQLGGNPQLTEVSKQRLCVFAALHDIGKFNQGFQRKIQPLATRTAGHVNEVLSLFADFTPLETTKLCDALSFDELLRWGVDEEAINGLLVATICHHGNPRPLGRNHQSSNWTMYDGIDPFAGLEQLVEATRSWYPIAWDTDTDDLLPNLPSFQHAACGLFTLCDWLGSDDRFFKYYDTHHRPDLNNGRITDSRDRAKEALARTGVYSASTRDSLTVNRTFFESFGFAPRPLQQAVQELSTPAEGSLAILEAPTGEGKTEAAISRFIELYAANLVDGMFFALPTRTAATQIHARVTKVVERIFPDEKHRPPVVLAVPGYLLVDETSGQHLPGFEVLWHDSNKERWRYRGWAAEHPKRYIAGAIVVGTIDQVLMSHLAVSHSHMRATALLRHLLIVDEVHASDAYMTRILEETLTYHLRAAGHVFLMSATLGEATRRRYLDINQPRQAVCKLDDAKSIPFPALMFRTAQSGKVETQTCEVQYSKSVTCELSPIMEQPQTIAELALDAARSGAKVIVLRNTVTDCVAVQQVLQKMCNHDAEHLLFTCNGMPSPHHSRFSRDDRMALDRAIEEQFGKTRSPEGRIVVATQTVQQSLDLDADFMITDLCPIDVLLQRIGRLHRHERETRVPGFEDAKIVVLTPAERELSGLLRPDGSAKNHHGLGYPIYDDLCIIEATWRVLERTPTFLLPRDSRALVEDSLHPAALESIAAAKGPVWSKHRNNLLGAQISNARTAKLSFARWDKMFIEEDVVFTVDEMHRKIMTRLGTNDRIVRFSEAISSPFGTEIKLLTLPSFMLNDSDEKELVAHNVDSYDNTICFHVGKVSFVYDNNGYRRTPDE